MGEIAELILDGVLCQYCGVLMPDFEGEGEVTEDELPGYPRACPQCEKEEPDHD